ncbi:dynactin p62 [Amniculicola lignicola CBS 123094]|uniref:Dynactin subunit 4 n=1 Tax=Amniculicola lignicola CBS 123094 TaxID=1392246 RepID=A0A6A5WG26_9PLEO|nr:dynactin p62 [Amniculicola lignicola CBS 123094]
MAQPFPYTYYSCDCYDSKVAAAPTKHASQGIPPAEDEDERDFDPRSPGANYSLYPLEHLLYCEDCQQIRCPRCVVEETLNWYCPSCLFEVPSSVVKTDGNRCTRNCYNCPVCSSPAVVTTLEDPFDPSSSGGPWLLLCTYCKWTSLEIGIEFEKHTGITAQLARLGNGGRTIPSHKEREKERERRLELDKHKSRDILSGSEDSPTTDKRDDGPPSHDDIYANLSAFYKSQLAAQQPSNPFSPHDINFSSPSSFSRIMNLYSSSTSKKQKREKPTPMREAASPLEGLTLHSPSTDTAIIDRLKTSGWSRTLSPAQKLAQMTPTVRFTSDLRPLASILCTKRGKRCRSCRHILSKPESKITSTRYKIKLLARNHIPRLSLRALHTSTSASASATAAAAAILPFNYDSLRPGLPIHFLLHISNPLFDPVRVTLATPSLTPGRVHTRVTILCPQFDVGANTDVWDDALSGSTDTAAGGLKRFSASGEGGAGRGTEGSGGAVEAGKIWERGRNWTSVVLEVVPGKDGKA